MIYTLPRYSEGFLRYEAIYREISECLLHSEKPVSTKEICRKITNETGQEKYKHIQVICAVRELCNLAIIKPVGKTKRGHTYAVSVEYRNPLATKLSALKEAAV